MLHNLKIKSEYFNDVISGKKTFEIRFNDKNYKVCDTLNLREIDDKGNYTGNEQKVFVIYLFDDVRMLQKGYVILGIETLK